MFLEDVLVKTRLVFEFKSLKLWQSVYVVAVVHVNISRTRISSLPPFHIQSISPTFSSSSTFSLFSFPAANKSSLASQGGLGEYVVKNFQRNAYPIVVIAATAV